MAEAEKVHKAAADRYRFQVAGFKQQLEQARSAARLTQLQHVAQLAEARGEPREGVPPEA